MGVRILLENVLDGWRCSVLVGETVVETNVYVANVDSEQAPARGYALSEANFIITARQRFEDSATLANFISAYRTTPQFEAGPLSSSLLDDESLLLALRTAVKCQDSVAALICRGLLDITVEQRVSLVEKLND